MKLFGLRLSDVITAVQELEPSQYSTQRMIEWLSDLDGEIWNEVVLTHVWPFRHFRHPRHLWDGDPLNQGIRGTQYPGRPRPEREPESRGTGENDPEIDVEIDEDEEPGGGGRDRRENHRHWKWPYMSVDDLLIAGNPYGKEMYIAFLQSKIAYHNAEQAKYAIYAAAYNDAYAKFSAWYNRTYMPAMENRGNRLKF